ncbi:PAS domain-containing protein [Hwanghaeella grinnelliae]|nr:PAS domain-containing protein [Hwanghaeella grinnelliae]
MLRIAFRHWNEVRGDRVMPERREIDPLELRRTLTRTWLYEREDDMTYRCRLAGEEINSAYGRPIQSRLARDVIGPKFDAVVRLRWDYALDRGAVYHGFSKSSAVGPTIERLCVPLADSDGTPRFVFGVSQYFDSAAPKLDQNSFNFISLDVNFYEIPTFQRLFEDVPA